MIAMEDMPVENVAQLSCMAAEPADWRMAWLSMTLGSGLLNQEPILFLLDLL